MLTRSQTTHQQNFFYTDFMMQLDTQDPLLLLAQEIPWRHFDEAFKSCYNLYTGRPAKPVRLMVGLLILKQLEDLSDEQVVMQVKRNPYYQAFCGFTEFQQKPPCDASDLVYFRQRIGAAGVEEIFATSVKLHG